MRISDWSSDVCSSDLGDNDGLAARIAQAADANAVVLLSDIDGLYTANPHKYPDARLIEHVEAITDEIVAMADGGPSRSAESRVGKEWVSSCKSRWSPYHSKNK